MSDPNNQLLLLLAAATHQQQQQQQAATLQAQIAKIQKVMAGASGASSGASAPSSSKAPAPTPAQNNALAQQINQIAQFGALMAAQKKQLMEKEKEKEKKALGATTSSTATSSVAGMSPEQLAMWQQAIQLQALQQMMMTSPKNQMEEAIKKMMELSKKKGAPGAATASNGANSDMMNNMMWQLVAQQMQQKQQQQQKESQKKAEQLKKAKELARQQQKEQETKNKQQEEIVKFLMAQHQVNHQKKQQKKQEEAVALATVLAARAAALSAQEPSEDGAKKSSEAMVRLPLQLGWRRQTCVRVISAGGVRGDVSYFAPCGKKLSTYSEVVRYLAKNGISYLNRDNFSFTTKLIIGEFIVPKPSENDDLRQEREFLMMSEDEISKELARLNVLKTVPKPTFQFQTADVAEQKATAPQVVEPEEPLDLRELNDEFLHHQEDVSMGGAGEECKVREREMDDLLVNNEVRHLPEFTRIQNQCLSSKGFADALMVHEFVQNFGHVLGIDLEKAPKLEALCAGLSGDAQKGDSVLQLTRQLLRLALEFPGMKNEKRFGQGGGEMGLDRENFSEVMRLFLVDKGARGEEISTPLLTANFLALRGEEKAAILAFLCDELVCSRNVVTEIDRNLDEISRLKGEKWMREGKARALKSARNKKPAESDSEPPTRPMTPKSVQPPVVSSSPALRKFTPGLGQCEVLTEQEEAMSLEQMDGLISELQNEAHNINQKIHDTNLRIRSFPFGTDRFHRNFWLLPHTNAVLVESMTTSSANNPACNIKEIAAKDPPLLEHRLALPDALGLEMDVLACVEDLVDEVVLTRAGADKDKKIRKLYRRVENSMKRGWWSMSSKEMFEALKSSLLNRGIRERALHRLLTKSWFQNDLKFGTITLEPVGGLVDLELVERQGWRRLSDGIQKLQSHIKMADVARSGMSNNNNGKPNVVPTSMALAQIVKDDVEWTVVGEEEPLAEEQKMMLREQMVETSMMIDPKFWRPAFQSTSVPFSSSDSVENGAEIQALNGAEKSETKPSELYEQWKEYVLHGATTSSQLMVALQALEGMVMWERSVREALCQICKSMDGDEMLVCDGCESGCHMECFRPRITKVPEGDWFCQRCREEKTGKPTCMFCSKETGTLYKCQRCAYHVHQDCAQDAGPKETIKPDSFICSHCSEMKQMRFVKRVMLRGESEEREHDEEHDVEHKNGAMSNGVGGQSKQNLKRKMEPSSNGGLPVSMNQELCQLMLDELCGQSNSFPFLEPVNPKLVPGYKMVIVKPIDLGTIRQKNEKMSYETPEDFAEDIELMFANCRQFNIDHSEIGRAGHNLNKFFQKRWKQLKYNFTKRLRRLHRHV